MGGFVWGAQGSGTNVVVGDGHVSGADVAGDNGELSGSVRGGGGVRADADAGVAEVRMLTMLMRPPPSPSPPCRT